ncbi:MAG TPA: hypothetical protein VFP32_01790 [Candidatus Saccharimonadales bacterium]|nr:hypothetical protein [Candidatus Saccharimonadales bacterium]
MKAFKRVISVLLFLALLAVPFVVWWKAQALTDWWQLRNYTPPAAVVSLASQDTMTSYARHVFYVNHPDIESDASQFRTDCNESEKAIVLGCYHSNQDGIFIYDVQDQRLAGVEQVTAAHEMLHAAYDRLSGSDKNRIDGMLQSYYNNGLNDQRIKDEINSYKQTEPNDLVNEMHSIFGTEVANLPSGLQTYYQKYFSNRQAIVDFADSYQDEFTSRENQMRALAGELAQTKSQIEAEEQSLKGQLAQLNADRANLDSQRSSGNASAYNSQIATFNREVDSYNSGVAQLKSDINEYNQLVDQYNSVAKELASLQQSIDTRLTPQTTQ